MKATSSDSTTTTKMVTVVGPECTGKTDLTRFLAEHFATDWVPEYARAYLNKLNHGYDESDLLRIAHGQLRLEDEWRHGANRVLFCDTNLIVIKVWSEAKYNRCSDEILRLMEGRRYDLLLLTNIDIPWENDPQREHPDKREHFMEIYRKETAASGIPVVEISGEREARRAKAVQAVQQLISA